MELTLNDLYKGNATKIKGVEYLPTEAYIDPFINICKKYTNEFIVDAVLAPQISVDNDNEYNIYNRVYIQAVLPEAVFDNHKQVLGMIYALDTRMPILKLFTGGLNMACTNLCVFNPDALQVSQIEEKKNFNLSFINEMGKYMDEVSQKLTLLSQTSYGRDKDTVTNLLGEWVDNAIYESQTHDYAKVKLGTSDVIGAYKDLFVDKNSKYYQSTDKGNVSLFDIYNAFTDRICNGSRSDIITKPEKVLLLSKILNF